MAGYPPYQKLLEKYEVLEPPIGKGAFGMVRRCRERSTGVEYALKSVRKKGKYVGGRGKGGMPLDMIKKEIDIQTLVGKSLNAVHLYAAYEDREQVHILMELCTGGELWKRVGDLATGGRFSEATAAELVRAMCRMLAQCHACNVVYRDIKPENFLYLDESPKAPVKGVDFGLAEYCLPGKKLYDKVGTCFYVAPEVLTKDGYGPPADMWGIGVVTYQLLTGRLPFTDAATTGRMPTKGRRYETNDVLASVETRPIEDIFEDDAWEGVGVEGKEFCRLLLQREAEARPSAVEALEHPWLGAGGVWGGMGGTAPGEATEAPLSGSLVQRLQRFAMYSDFKRLVMRNLGCEVQEDDAQLEALRALFRSVDPDGEGHVPSALIAGLLWDSGYVLTQPEIDRLLQGMEHMCSWTEQEAGCEGGNIYIDEFVAALADWQDGQRAAKWRQIAERAFHRYDRTGNGLLEVQDLVEELCPVDVNDRESCSSTIQEAVRSQLGWAAADREGDELDLVEWLNLLGSHVSSDNLDLYQTRYIANDIAERQPEEAQ